MIFEFSYLQNMHVLFTIIYMDVGKFLNLYN
jgi:hypothetical protein